MLLLLKESYSRVIAILILVSSMSFFCPPCYGMDRNLALGVLAASKREVNDSFLNPNAAPYLRNAEQISRRVFKDFAKRVAKRVRDEMLAHFKAASGKKFVAPEVQLFLGNHPFSYFNCQAIVIQDENAPKGHKYHVIFKSAHFVQQYGLSPKKHQLSFALQTPKEIHEIGAPLLERHFAAIGMDDLEHRLVFRKIEDLIQYAHEANHPYFFVDGFFFEFWKQRVEAIIKEEMSLLRSKVADAKSINLLAERRTQGWEIYYRDVEGLLRANFMRNGSLKDSDITEAYEYFGFDKKDRHTIDRRAIDRVIRKRLTIEAEKSPDQLLITRQFRWPFMSDFNMREYNLFLSGKDEFKHLPKTNLAVVDDYNRRILELNDAIYELENDAYIACWEALHELATRFYSAKHDYWTPKLKKLYKQMERQL